jgi:hypothetical protein
VPQVRRAQHEPAVFIEISDGTIISKPKPKLISGRGHEQAVALARHAQRCADQPAQRLRVVEIGDEETLAAPSSYGARARIDPRPG